MINNANLQHHMHSLTAYEQYLVVQRKMSKKYGLIDKEVLEHFEHKMLVRIEIEQTHSNLQV